MTDGARDNGFSISCGIRQGCPLSPPLFAVASDSLFRRLQRLLPDGCFRAYADDLAVVLPDCLRRLCLLEDILIEYEIVSGLALRIPKAVYIPSYVYKENKLRLDIHRVAPSWGAIAIKQAAKY